MPLSAQGLPIGRSAPVINCLHQPSPRKALTLSSLSIPPSFGGALAHGSTWLTHAPIWAREMLRAGVVWSLVVMAALTPCGYVASGARGAVSVLFMGTAVLGYFVIGQLVQLLAFRKANIWGLLLVLESFVGRIGVLGVLLWQMVTRPLLRAYVADAWLLTSGCAAVIAWTGGVVWAHAHARIPVYDREYVSPSNGTRST
jgi:hypothetical protein